MEKVPIVKNNSGGPLMAGWEGITYELPEGEHELKDLWSGMDPKSKLMLANHFAAKYAVIRQPPETIIKGKKIVRLRGLPNKEPIVKVSVNYKE